MIDYRLNKVEGFLLEEVVVGTGQWLFQGREGRVFRCVEEGKGVFRQGEAGGRYGEGRLRLRVDDCSS